MVPDQLSRRRYLQTTAVAALMTAGVGCQSNGDKTIEPTDAHPSETPDPAKTRSMAETGTKTDIPQIVQQYQDRFDAVVDIAAAGANLEGTEPINGIIDDHLGDDTLLYFPAGRYTLDQLQIHGKSNVGLVASPDEEVTIAPAAPIETIGNHFIDFRSVSNILLEGLTFDYTEKGYGGAVRVIASGDIVVRDLQTRGALPDQNRNGKHVAYRFDVRNPDSTGIVKRIVARDGGHKGGNGVGIYVGKDHAGSLTFRDCEIANFPNNGLYASAPGQTLDGYTGANGIVHVEGGSYENNNIANVRIGSTGSTVRDVTVVVDKVPPSPSPNKLNVRGIRLREREDLLVENCEIEIGANAGEGFGAISYHPQHGTSTVRNTEIRVDRDDYSAISATDSSNGGTEAPLRFDHVTVTGTATGGAAVEIADRSETEFQNCRIEQSGADRNGIVLINSRNCLVADSTIRVTGEPIVEENSTTSRRSLTIEDR